MAGEGKERYERLRTECIRLRDILRSNGQDETVAIYAEDWAYLERLEAISTEISGERTFEGCYIKKGPRKRKARKKRPPDLFDLSA